MIPKKLWTYWEGEKPPFIDFCLKSIEKNCGVEYKLLTDANYEEYIGKALHDNHRKITSIAQKADCIRIAVLKNHGGMWCDADTILLRSLEPFFLNISDAVLWKWNFNNKFLNGYLLAQKNGKWINSCLKEINYILDENPRPIYEDEGGCLLGEYVFSRATDANPGSIVEMPLSTMIPIEFPTNPGMWSETGSVIGELSENTRAIALNYSQMTGSLRTMSVEEIKRGDTYLSSAIKCAEKCNGKCVAHCAKYSRAKRKVVISPNILADAVKAVGLPAGFGPTHPDFKVPSKNYKYKMAMESAEGIKKIQPNVFTMSNLDTTKKPYKNLLITTFVSGDYEWYIPLFYYCAKKAYPYYDISIYVRSHDKDIEVLDEFKFLKGSVIPYTDDTFPEDGHTTAAMRFVYSDKYIESFDYVFITDIDILMMQESTSLLDQHVDSMKKNKLGCYDNYQSEICDGGPRLPGVHFITKDWWKTTKTARAKYLKSLKLKGSPDWSYDEVMLGKIVSESGLAVNSLTQNLWAHHGVHLGAYRNISRKQVFSGVESSFLGSLVKDRDFMSIVDKCADKLPLIKRIIYSLKSNFK